QGFSRRRTANAQSCFSRVEFRREPRWRSRSSPRVGLTSPRLRSSTRLQRPDVSVAATSPFATALLAPSPSERRDMTREPAQLSDEALVEAIARADEDALGVLYDRFGKVAYGLAFRILQDASLAEDAVKEAFPQTSSS